MSQSAYVSMVWTVTQSAMQFHIDLPSIAFALIPNKILKQINTFRFCKREYPTGALTKHLQLIDCAYALQPLWRYHKCLFLNWKNVLIDQHRYKDKDNSLLMQWVIGWAQIISSRWNPRETMQKWPKDKHSNFYMILITIIFFTVALDRSI